jgi:hypothetical protein
MKITDEAIHKILKDSHAYPGWCWFEKARAMADLIDEIKPSLVVEIGVFGGASFFPQVEAIKANGNGGFIIGVEPFSNNAALQGQTGVNSDWWGKINFEEIRQKVASSRIRHGAEAFSAIWDWTSEQAVSAWQTLGIQTPIDILHIDGNHSSDSARFDVIHWGPFVRKDGYVWFDDANWDSVQPAIKELSKTFKHIKDVPNNEGTQLVSLFQKL